MSQLPPKAPPMPTTVAASSAAPWVDEFLHFSSAKRGAHRRSISDSIAFLELHLPEECQSSSSPAIPSAPHHHLDDDQLMSIFSGDPLAAPAPAASASCPSTPSDHNSINDEPATQTRNDLEVQSSCQSDALAPPPSTSAADPILDHKRVKRQSAQRSRVRKLQYISELERSVTTLQTEVSALSPRVALLDHQRLVLNVDNSALKQRIAALAQDKLFKDAHQEALKKEIERLRQVYHQQNLATMATNKSKECSEQSQACSNEELVN